MRTTAINCWLFDHYGAMLNPIGRCRIWLDLHTLRLRWRWHVAGRHWIKRGFDVVVSASVLVALSPLADRRRLAVAPGITGLWRIGEGGDIGFSSQVNLDVQYIETQSFHVDIQILVKTLPAVMSGTGAY